MPQSLPVSMSASAQLRARVLKVVGWTLGGLTLAATLVRAVVGPLHPQILMLALALCAVLLALPFFGSAKRWSPRLGIAVTLVFLLLVLSTSYLAGGLRAPAIVFLMVVPLLGIVLVGRGFGVIVMAAVFAGLATLLLLHQFAVVPDTQLTGQGLLFMRAFMLAVALLVVSAALAIYEKHSQELMLHFHREALTDPLTQLHNRRYLEMLFPQLVESARQWQEDLWVALIDVDHLKQINDSRGHGAGDQALQRVADTLLSAATKAPGSVLARLAGDEFVVVSVCGRGSLKTLMERAQAMLAEPVGEEPMLSISVGMVGLPPEGPVTDKLLHQLLARADAGLYRAKRSGRHRVVIMEVEPDAVQAPAMLSDQRRSPTRLSSVSE